MKTQDRISKSNKNTPIKTVTPSAANKVLEFKSEKSSLNKLQNDLAGAVGKESLVKTEDNDDYTYELPPRTAEQERLAFQSRQPNYSPTKFARQNKQEQVYQSDEENISKTEDSNSQYHNNQNQNSYTVDQSHVTKTVDLQNTPEKSRFLQDYSRYNLNDYESSTDRMAIQHMIKYIEHLGASEKDFYDNLLVTHMTSKDISLVLKRINEVIKCVITSRKKLGMECITPAEKLEDLY